jgi:hypothetical protein
MIIVDTTIAESTRAATKKTVGMRRIAGSATTVAPRAMYTTAQARRRSLSTETETRRAAGGAKATNGKIHVPAASAGMTGAGKRGAMSREVRPATGEADEVVEAASAEAAVAVAAAGTDKEQFSKAFIRYENVRHGEEICG